MAARFPGGIPAFSPCQSSPCHFSPGQIFTSFGSPPTRGSQPDSLPFPRGRNPRLVRPGEFPRLATPPSREAAATTASGRRRPDIPSLSPLHLLIASTRANGEPASAAATSLVSAPRLHFAPPPSSSPVSPPPSTSPSPQKLLYLLGFHPHLFLVDLGVTSPRARTPLPLAIVPSVSNTDIASNTTQPLPLQVSLLSASHTPSCRSMVSCL